jgi:indole-3-glycerol phosphate synthase
MKASNEYLGVEGSEDFLRHVTRQRREDAEMLAAKRSLESLQREAALPLERRSLADRLRRAAGFPAVLAEVKRASPSAGILRELYDPALIARQYQQAGAAAISVLTEPHYFLGNSRHLLDVREAVSLPILRKDFISTLYQVYESAALGADAVLLIAAALDFGTLRELYVVAMAIGLEVVVEVHTREELEIVLPLARTIIGVNNRNLKTLRTDLQVSRDLAPLIPRDRLAISESGIRTRDDILELQALGYAGFLVGESLLRSHHPGLALSGLIGPRRHGAP